MGSFSDYAENKILEHIVGKTSFTMPTAYIALCTTAPTDASTGSTLVEPSGNNYSRKATVGGDWAAASGGSISNSGSLAFPQASGSWGTITHFAIVDASANGNVIAWGALSASKAVGSGDTPSFAAGQLTVTQD